MPRNSNKPILAGTECKSEERVPKPKGEMAGPPVKCSYVVGISAFSYVSFLQPEKVGSRWLMKMITATRDT